MTLWLIPLAVWRVVFPLMFVCGVKTPEYVVNPLPPAGFVMVTLRGQPVQLDCAERVIRAEARR